MRWFSKGREKEGDGGQLEKAETPQPVRPQSSLEAEKQAFIKMVVPFNEVVSFSRARGRPLTSVELEMTTKQIRQALRGDCFDFEPTYHQVFGAMLDIFLLFSRQRKVYPLGQVVVWREADRRLRQELGIDRRVELKTEERKRLEEIFQSLIKEAQAKKATTQAQIGGIKGQVNLSVGQAPIITKTVEELILWEAEVQARRALKLGKDDPIPPVELQKQESIAWQKWRKNHGLNEPKVRE